MKLRECCRCCVNVLTQFIHAGDLSYLRRSFGECHKEVDFRLKNEVSHLCDANEPVSTMTRSVE